MRSFERLWQAALAGVVALALTSGLAVVSGDLTRLPVLVACLLLLFPWTAARRIFIPLGMWRAAWATGELARLSWPGGGAGLVAGAWALCRRRRPPDAGLRWLERRLESAELLTAAHILGAGLLAAARGDRAAARRLCESLEGLDPTRETTGRARLLAREWLATEAAERGEWRRVAAIARRPGKSTRAARFLGAAAARLAGDDDAPSDRRLRLLWLRAPRRRRTRALLERALVRSGRAGSRPLESPPRMVGIPRDSLGRALTLHVAVLARPADQVQMQDIELLGDAWDRVLSDDEFRLRLRDRATLLGSASADRAAEELLGGVQRELAALARAARHPLDLIARSSATVEGAAGLLREELLAEVELAFESLGRRTAARRPHRPIDEWREYLALGARYEEAVSIGGMSLRRLAFPHVHHVVCDLAVWLWNDREEHAIANAMFRWLLDEAITVGDEEAIALQRHNVAPTE